MRSWRCVWAGCACLLLGACGDDSSTPAPSPDAGLIVDQPAPPEPPHIDWYDPTTGEESLAVAPPAIAPCPDGWREVDGACDPWPESGRRDCPPGAAHFPGEPDCVPIGAACPPGDFALGLPDDGTVLFVRDGAVGDGTRAAPFGTIAEALAVATPGSTVALAKGVYYELIVLPEGVTLAGACAAETQLSPTIGAAYAVVYTEAAGTALADLSIVEGGFPGIMMRGATSSMDVRGVLIAGVPGVGVVVGGAASMTLDRLVIRGTRATADSDGRAFIAQEGARATVTHAIIEGNLGAGISAGGPGTQIVVRDAAIHDTRGDGIGLGRGVWAGLSAQIELERVEIATSYEAGVFAEDGATVTLSRGVVRDTTGYVSDFVAGPGVFVDIRGTVNVSRSLISRNHTYGVYVGGVGVATLSDVIIRDTRPDPGTDSYGFGMLVRDTGQATLTRTVVSGNELAGIRLYTDPATLDATDLVVRDTVQSAADGSFGRGIEVLDGASLTLRRARIEGNRGDGIFAVRSTIDAEDLVVADTSSQDGENDGRGITCGMGSTCGVRRAALLRNAAAGMIVAGTTATIEDLVVTDTQDRAGGADASGVGLDVRDGVQVSARRVLARDNHVIGIAASGVGTTLTLEDATIEGTIPRAATGDLGLALVAATGAHLSAIRVLARRNHLAGLYVGGPETRATLSDIHVVDTSSSPVDGRGGIGALITQAAAVEMTRSLWERNREVTVLVALASTLRASHVTIVEPLPAECGEACGGGFGAGLRVSSGGSASVDHFRIDSSPQCAAWITAGSGLDLADGEIARSEIGACVHATDYDVQRLTERVRYTDNRVNIETVDFLAPEPEVSLEGL